MAGLSQLTFAQMQQQLASQYNANANIPANTGPGSALGAVFNAISLLSLQLQGQINYVNTIARLATSSGADIDSFCLPFGITRNAAVSATGTVTFSTPSPAGSQIVIPTGTYVQTNGGIQFTVIADTTQPGYNATAGGYIIAAGSQSVAATVQAVIPGTGGNIQAGTITSILSTVGAPAPQSVNSVSNTQPFSNGATAETDTALINRFATTMQSRWATTPAVSAAIGAAQGGLTYQIGDMLDQNGNAKPNFFSVIVNVLGQNSGPSSAILSTVTTAVINNRPCGVPFTVVGPTLIPVNVSATLTLASGASSGSVTAAATTALNGYLNGIGLSSTGATTYARYSQVIVVLSGVTGVANVTNVTINGGAVDLSAGFGSQLVAGAYTLTTQ